MEFSGNIDQGNIHVPKLEAFFVCKACVVLKNLK